MFAFSIVVATVNVLALVLIGWFGSDVRRAQREGRVNNTATVVYVLSALGFVISLLLLIFGQALLGAVFAALGLVIAAGKLFAGGLLAGAGSYVAERIMKQRKKKATTTAPHKDD
jgi:hypothetical protein